MSKLYLKIHDNNSGFNMIYIQSTKGKLYFHFKKYTRYRKNIHLISVKNLHFLFLVLTKN